MRLNNEWDVELKVQNIDGIVANFHAASAGVQRDVLALVGDFGARMEQRTVDLCPKRTFYMSEHVRTDFSDAGYTVETGWDASDFLGTTDAHGHPRSFYPPYVEFGTRHMRAQPSLTLAWNELSPAFAQQLSDILRRHTTTTGGG
jgi:HK97 gp10 family phage protein